MAINCNLAQTDAHNNNARGLLTFEKKKMAAGVVAFGVMARRGVLGGETGAGGIYAVKRASTGALVVVCIKL